MSSIALDFKQQFAEQLARKLKKNQITQTELARLMRTSRAVVYRVLDPEDISLSLKTMASVARAIDCHLNIVLR